MCDPQVTVTVFGHGRRECLDATLASFDDNVDPALITARLIFDDSADADYQNDLAACYPRWGIVGAATRAGFGGNIARAWRTLPGVSSCRFVFHLEEDFVFNQPVDLQGMIRVLDSHPYLAQLALLRQPWGPTEEAVGGFVAADRASFTNHTDGTHDWFEHRKFFTTNPSLYRLSLTRHGWPDGDHSEGVFTHRLLADPDIRFGYWGRTEDPPAVHHIGDSRTTGEGY